MCLVARVGKFISVAQTNGGPSAVHLYVTEAARYPTSVGTISPSRAELVARAIELQPLLREHAPQMDAQRQLSDEVNTALVDAGLFRLLTPKRFGGYESGLRTAVEVTAALGAADGSTAWLVGIGTGARLATRHVLQGGTGDCLRDRSRCPDGRQRHTGDR
jgi:alkylation response protein AidB-like acyl-CoA dehydrogenase